MDDATTGGRAGSEASDRSVVVATLNLLDDLRYWDRRAPLVLAEFERLQPDLIALQEVSLPLDQARWLSDELGGYEVLMCPKSGRRSGREALSVLSRLPVVAHDTYEYGLQNRVAQRAVVQTEGKFLAFSNTHLHFDPFQDVTRAALASRLLHWLPDDVPTVLCGDMNAEPGYRSMRALRGRFRSAHVAANGSEPAWTCPTPLHRGPGARNAMRRFIIVMAGPVLLRKKELWRGTIDYIFVDPEIEVMSCEVAFGRPDPNDERVYPSDHLGLVARLQPR
jgi:endonuclease/exonuclease/phosphatase family metal-dependent hydrolase